MKFENDYSLYDEIVVLSLIGHSQIPHRKLSEEVIIRFIAVIGSGGHTMEMLSLIRSLKQKNYKERYYIVADTDILSEDKIHTLEKETFDYGKYIIKKIPRSREVGQSYFTSIFSTLKAFFACIKIVFQLKPNILFTNGPGTAIPVVFSVLIFDILLGRDCRVVFSESFARVNSLSLTGKILYYTRLADVIIVQWDDLIKKFPRVEYIPFFYTFVETSKINELKKLE